MLKPEEIEQLEISREQAKKAIAKGEALQRLMNSDDYKLIISEGFFKTYPTDLGLAIANNTGAYDPSVLMKTLEGINTLKGYEFKIAMNMDAAIQDLNQIEELIANSVKE